MAVMEAERHHRGAEAHGSGACCPSHASASLHAWGVWSGWLWWKRSNTTARLRHVRGPRPWGKLPPTECVGPRSAQCVIADSTHPTRLDQERPALMRHHREEERGAGNMESTIVRHECRLIPPQVRWVSGSVLQLRADAPFREPSRAFYTYTTGGPGGRTVY
jgi:hypothetical protein